jgi:nucleoside-diphosphate-sugar epimerase
MEQLELFVDFTHDDGKPVSLVAAHVYMVRPKQGGGSFVVSNGGTPVPVKEDRETIRRAVNKALGRGQDNE